MRLVRLLRTPVVLRLQKTDSGLTLTRQGLTVTVDPDSGLVTSLSSDTDSIQMDGIFVDAGIAEASVFEQLGYKDMGDLATYELPTLYPRMREKTAYTVGAITVTEEGFEIPLTWTFDAARAQSVYGTERAKAMWMILGWIDGVLYIYQGDEDPAAYHLDGENLEEFFTDLIDAKRSYVPNTLDTEYLNTGSTVFACRRFDVSTSRLVLVNLSDQEAVYTLDEPAALLTSIGDCTLSGNTVILAPYSGAILQER